MISYSEAERLTTTTNSEFSRYVIQAGLVEHKPKYETEFMKKYQVKNGAELHCAWVSILGRCVDVNKIKTRLFFVARCRKCKKIFHFRVTTTEIERVKLIGCGCMQ